MLSLIEEDELRLVRFFLSNTCLNIRIGGTKEEKKFTSNIGKPQGDSLSPILFVVYLENALKEVRPILPESEKTLAKLQNVWVRGDKLKKKTKLKLYRALVKSVLTYNCSTWALTQAEEIIYCTW